MKRLLLSLMLAMSVGAVHAQSEKTNKIIVGFPPGQATDQVARMLANEMSNIMGESFIVENKPGQGGSIALAGLARTEPAGDTMVLAALASMVVNPHLYKNVGYKTLEDFDLVAMVADLPLLMVVNPDVPAKTYKEFIAYAKANPGKLNHPSSGNGTLSHLGMEELKRAAGLDIVHIPYAGSARAMTDLVGGGVQVALDTVPVTQTHIRAGKLRLLATTYNERLEAFPDTPTIAELGMPGFRLSAWLGLVMPKGTPPERVKQISDAAIQAVQRPAVQEKYKALSVIPRTMPTAEFRPFVEAEYKRWGENVKAAKLTVD